MELVVEEAGDGAYLEQTAVVNFGHPAVAAVIAAIRERAGSDEIRAKLAFEYVRDEVAHSFDTDSELITIRASDVAERREGICFAKSHLLAAILRGLGIATGFCYQRVTRKGTPESGYALHGLNAAYFKNPGRWVRLDPRGDKPGVHSAFTLTPDEERLAYDIRPELGEVDYPYVFAAPLETVLQAMGQAPDCRALFYARPAEIPDETT